MNSLRYLFLILVFSVTAASGAKFPVCKEYYYVNENKTHEKSTFLEKILKEDPGNVECMLKLASLYLRTDKVAAAFDLIRRAYTLDPDFVEKQTISKILDLALRLSRLGELAHKNSDKDLYNELGDTYYEVGIFDEAVKAYENSLRLDENQSKVKISLSLSYANLGKYIESEKILRSLVEKEPYNFYANYYIGKILKSALSQPKEGNIYLRMALYLMNYTDIEYEKEGDEEFFKKDINDELKGSKE